MGAPIYDLVTVLALVDPVLGPWLDQFGNYVVVIKHDHNLPAHVKTLEKCGSAVGKSHAALDDVYEFPAQVYFIVSQLPRKAFDTISFQDLGRLLWQYWRVDNKSPELDANQIKMLKTKLSSDLDQLNQWALAHDSESNKVQARACMMRIKKMTHELLK